MWRMMPVETKAIGIADLAFVKTEGSNLNIRSGPSTSYSIVFRVPNNYIVTILNETPSGWDYVSVTYRDGSTNSTYTGYCSSQYLQRVESEHRIIQLYSSDGFINIRSAPSNSTIITSYPSYSYMLALDANETSNYYYVYCAKTQSYGYVHKSVAAEIYVSPSASTQINALILLDESFPRGTEYADTLLYDATLPYIHRWGIELHHQRIINYNYTLDADSCPYGYTNACTSACYQAHSHDCTHSTDCCCKCLYNLIYQQQSKNFLNTYTDCDIQIGLTGIRSCVGGLAPVNGKHATIMIKDHDRFTEEYVGNVRRLQHEVAHLFNNIHNGDEGTYCTSSCIMNGGFDNIMLFDLPTIWCSRCAQRFNNHF